MTMGSPSIDWGHPGFEAWESAVFPVPRQAEMGDYQVWPLGVLDCRFHTRFNALVKLDVMKLPGLKVPVLMYQVYSIHRQGGENHITRIRPGWKADIVATIDEGSPLKVPCQRDGSTYRFTATDLVGEARAMMGQRRDWNRRPIARRKIRRRIPLASVMETPNKIH